VLLKNRQLEVGSLVCSRSGNIFLILEVVPLSRQYVGVRYMWQDGDVVYTEEKWGDAFLTDCLCVRPGGIEVDFGASPKRGKDCRKD
jgi:hypothetical protein